MEDHITPETCWVPSEALERFTTDVFKGLGVPDAEASICADVLITADKRGISSHGVSRLKPIYYDRIVHDKVLSPKTNFEVVRDHKATAVVDGHHGMGMVIAHRCMEMAIEKARDHGVGVVVVRDSTHYGMAAYYPLMAAAEGMVGMTSTNARPSVAPTLGVENMLGTNPLVYAFPSDEPFPFTNDYATSVIQRGMVEIYAREGKPLPAGLVIDHEGKSKTDSREVLQDFIDGKAAFAPVGGVSEETGGYKGYGFATVAELLSCALQQGAFLKQLSGFEDGKPVPHQLGHYFQAIDVNCFTDLDDFKHKVGDVLRSLRAARKAPGQKRIYTCGEKEYDASLEREKTGVPLGSGIQKELIEMRDELGLDAYSFEFE
jgi:LDH2 family malate/lactate/ureidoglycolate dehydrogenase